jgi:hypothetical protein
LINDCLQSDRGYLYAREMAALQSRRELIGAIPPLARHARLDPGIHAFALSFRGDAKHRTRNLEIPGLVLRTIPE